MADATKEELAESNSRMKAMLAKLREENASAIHKVVRTGTAGGSAWLFGFIEHRYPDKKTIFGVDLSLAAGLAGSAAAASGKIKDETLENVIEGVGTGGVCSWANKKGAIKGDADKTAADAKAA